MIVAAAFAVGFALLGSASHAAGPFDSKRYIGLGAGDITMVCGTEGLPGIGGDCFDVPSGGSAAFVSVNDEETGTVGFRVGFYGANGRIGALVPGCDSGTVDVPGGATLMRVFVDGLLNAAADCEAELPLAIGIFGIIDVSWGVESV